MTADRLGKKHLFPCIPPELLCVVQQRMSEQEGGTLLSSITVLSDSIHIGSMSPSNTIHLGPWWEMFACSRISDESKPYTEIEGHNKHMRLKSLDPIYTVLFGALSCVLFIKRSQFTIFPLPSCRMDKTKQFISVYCLWIEVIPYRLLFQVHIGFMENPQYLLNTYKSDI